MKYLMRAATLVLQLWAYAFATLDDFTTFAKALAKKVKITCMLEIWGDVTRPFGLFRCLEAAYHLLYSGMTIAREMRRRAQSMVDYWRLTEKEHR